MRAAASASVLVAFVLVLPGASAQPAPRASGTLLDTLTVDTGSPAVVTGKAQLKPGVEYTIEVTGTFTITSNSGNAGYTAEYDGLYCYDDNASAHNCTPPFRSKDFFVGVGSDKFDDLDHFQSRTTAHSTTGELPYHSDNTYEAPFYAPVAGPLKAAEYDAVSGCVAQSKPCGTHTNAGTVTVKLFGPASSGGGGGSSLPPITPASATPKLNVTTDYRVMAMGAVKAFKTPKVSRKSRDLTGNVSFVDDQGNPVDTPSLDDIDDATAGNAAHVCSVFLLARFGDEVEDFDKAFGTGYPELVKCIQVVATVLKRYDQIRQGKPGSRAVAAAAGCPVLIHHRRGSRAKLRVSCALTTTGVRVTIRAKAGGSLAKALGGHAPKLVVGRSTIAPASPAPTRLRVLWK